VIDVLLVSSRALVDGATALQQLRG